MLTQISTSSCEIMVMDENNAVVGVYTKTALSDGTFVYISDEGIPLSGWKNPQTGNAIPVGLPMILFIVSLCGAGVLIKMLLAAARQIVE